MPHANVMRACYESWVSDEENGGSEGVAAIATSAMPSERPPVAAFAMDVVWLLLSARRNDMEDFNQKKDRERAYRAIEEILDRDGSPPEAAIIVAVLTTVPITIAFPSLDILEDEVARGVMPEGLLQQVKERLANGRRALIMVNEQGAIVSGWSSARTGRGFFGEGLSGTADLP